jgi:hypothetical protein
MNRRSWTSRIALWAAVCALLLKAAMPVLATGAAKARDVAVADICSVYGVVALQPVSHPQGSDGQGSPGGTRHALDHCALTGLATLAFFGGAEPPLLPPSDEAAAGPRISVAYSAARDDCAAWAAQLHHGPPAFA